MSMIATESSTEGPQVVHTLPGRLRVHLPGWSGQGQLSLETHIRRMRGVEHVQATPTTGNILISFDPGKTNEPALLESLQRLDLATIQAQARVNLPHAIKEKRGRLVRARIAVRGLERDPQVAVRVIAQLKSRAGVQTVTASALTGRVLVEFDEHEADLDDLVAQVVDLELPELPGEDRPLFPLDPGPLIQSFTRTVGATLGFGLLSVRRLVGFTEPLPGAGVALQVASIIGILQGLPPVRYGLRHLLGRTAADLLLNIPGILSLTLAGSPLGLAVTGLESLRLLTEVQSRRAAWCRHEERISHAPSAQPDTEIRLEAGERSPQAALVLEGSGTAIGRDGMPQPAIPGIMLPAGARLYGGPFVLRLQHEASFHAFTPEPRPAPAAPSLFERYHHIVGLFSLGYAGVTGLLTRSFTRFLIALLLVNPRTATIGVDSADLGASARILRAGVTVVGTRANRALRLPSLLLLDGMRLLSDRLEISGVLPLNEEDETAELLAQAAGVAHVAGSPWGVLFRTAEKRPATEGHFDGKTATASLDGIRFTLGPVEDWSTLPEAVHLCQQGQYVLALTQEHEDRPRGLFALRPHLAEGLSLLAQTCRRHHVKLAVLSSGDQLVIRAFARRAHLSLLEEDDAIGAIRAHQQAGGRAAFVSDQVGASAAFAACDLAIGLTDDRYRLPARADLLAPDLVALATVIEATAYREAAVRDSIGFSLVANVLGLFWGWRAMPEMRAAMRIGYLTALAALADGWWRLRGGERKATTLPRLLDPRPERWGQRSIEQSLQLLQSSEQGLTSAQVASRQSQPSSLESRNPIFSPLLKQIRSPLIGILALGAGLSLLFGAAGDVIIISSTILVNVAVGAWQERQANHVAETLEHLSTSQARVLRDQQEITISAHELVSGDILLLAPGDRVAADARLIEAHGLEVDEAALTGESFPVSKAPDAPNEANRIVLEGSDVTTGHGRAVVVAVGQQTRMGTTRTALAQEEQELDPLGIRLSRILRSFLPISVVGGGVVIASGLLWGQPLPLLLATGATIALAAAPEGLPLLSTVSEAGVARRLASRQSVVRRLSAIEALGRVTVACADKTGTLTQGRLQLSLVATPDEQSALHSELSTEMRHVLLTAALASPHPDAPDADTHPTDRAVIQGALAAGLDEQIQVKHEEERAFDPVRSFHATLAHGRLCLKGAPEVVLAHCSQVMRNEQPQPLDEAERRALLARSQQIATAGLRLLMVAEGSPETPLDNPERLTVLGFVGIADPLRPTVRSAVQRCHQAGVRVLMITGDHPSTAQAIAREAGLLVAGGEVLTASQLAHLQNGELDQRLERAVVVARATPLDKLRIIESLQRCGHTVAMTGDGVNDAPALRLADIGVAMGRGSTEVARQTADVVIADDNFSTLVEALVEGRSFWRNIRRALGLLLGGNLGELGLVVGASLLGRAMPLTASQILAVNAITDIFPALAIAFQPPEHRHLAGLRREGAAALDKRLRNEVLRRGISTTLPSLAAYLVTSSARLLPEARTVAFTSIVTTQLAQTLAIGRAEAGGLSRSVFWAVSGSLGVLFAVFTVAPLRNVLGLAVPSPLGWGLIGGATLLSVLLNRVLATGLSQRTVPSAHFGSLPLLCR
jgi:cation-transporting ATPase I